MSDFRMPSLGADMVQGRIVEWRVRPGDHVRRGDIIVVVDTEKAAIEVEVFEDGVVDELLVPEGTRVPVGTVLARIRPDGAAPAAGVAIGAEAPETEAQPTPEARPAVEARPRASPAARVLAAERRIDLTTLSGTGPDGAVIRADVERAAAGPTAPAEETAGVVLAEEERHVRVSPLAERLAADLHVDLSAVVGTGPEGAITRADVERTAEERTAGEAPAAPGAPPPAPDRKLAMRQAIAAAVTRSKREIPHYYLSTRIDMSRALAWLGEENQRRPVDERLLPAALLLKAVALALREYPDFNGFWVDDAFQQSSAIHLGVAIALREGGLIAPAILSADEKSLSELMQALSDLVLRARSEGLRGSELTSPTITVTNLGDRGVDAVFGVIYPPQVALMGFGRIREQAWAENGMVGARPTVVASLAADHRASDGHRGSLLLDAIDRRLQHPEEL